MPAANPPAGWYPDPVGGTRLRWWDGEDWSDRYHTRGSLPAPPPQTARAAMAPPHGLGVRSGDEVDRLIAAMQQTARTEVDRAVGAMTHATRSELDRVAGTVRSQVRTVSPLVTEQIGALTRWIRTAFVVGVLVVAAYVVVQLLAEAGLADLLRDLADRVAESFEE